MSGSDPIIALLAIVAVLVTFFVSHYKWKRIHDRRSK